MNSIESFDQRQKLIDKQGQKPSLSKRDIYPQVFIFEDLMNESLENLERRWPYLNPVVAKGLLARHYWRVNEYQAFIESLEALNK